MSKRKARILTGVAVVVVALGVLYGVAVAASAYRLHNAYAALQKERRPMKIADIAPPQVPDSENAALLYQSAGLLLRAQIAEGHERRHLHDLAVNYVNGATDANQAAELEQLLQSDTVARVIAMVEQGTERSACRFDCDYEAGPAVRMPPLDDMRNFACLLGAKACLESKVGRSDDAWQTAQAQLRLARVLQTEPRLISQLVRFSITSLACKTMQVLARTAAPTAQQIRDVEQYFTELGSVDPLVLAVDGERLLFGEPIFGLSKSELNENIRERFSHGYTPEMFHRLLFWRVAFTPFLLADHAAYLRWSREYVRLFRDPNALDRMEAAEKEFYTTARRHALTSSLLPAFSRIDLLHYRMVTAMRITLSGLALLQYKQAHGSFPESLEALGIQSTEDPFARKSLVYRREGDGFVLYSVGEDRKDNGGTVKQPKQKTDYDVVWRFPVTGRAATISSW
jgi:hypothetical protein